MTGFARPMHWSADYVGIPYRARGRSRGGLDCWGVAVLAYRERHGIRLPSYADAYGGSAQDNAERRLVRQLADNAVQADIWHRVETPRDFDILLFGHGDMHVAVYAVDGLMLHVEERGDQVRLEDWRGSRWSGAGRLFGIFRYAQLMQAAP